MFLNWDIAFSMAAWWIALIERSETFSLSWRMQCLWVCAPASLCFEGLFVANWPSFCHPINFECPEHGMDCPRSSIQGLDLHLWDVWMITGSMTVPIGRLECEILAREGSTNIWTTISWAISRPLWRRLLILKRLDLLFPSMQPCWLQKLREKGDK